MKFVCDACGARYHIDDKKVAGKVLRIRCKKCAHVITVREPARAARPAPAVTRPPSAPAAIEWHYSVNGQSAGPVDEESLLALFAAGRIGDEAYVWHVGFAEWKPAFEVPVFRSAIADARSAAKAAGRPATERLEAAELRDLKLESRAMAAIEAPKERAEHQVFARSESAPHLAVGDSASADRETAARRAAEERAAAEHQAALRAEQERRAAEQAAAEQRAAQERLEAERIAAEQRAAAEKAAAERLAAERAEAERLAAERAEAERLAAERAEAERIAAERLAAEEAEAQRLAAERAEFERAAAAKADSERLAAARAEAEKAEAQRRAADELRIAAERRAAELDPSSYAATVVPAVTDAPLVVPDRDAAPDSDSAEGGEGAVSTLGSLEAENLSASAAQRILADQQKTGMAADKLAKLRSALRTRRDKSATAGPATLTGPTTSTLMRAIPTPSTDEPIAAGPAPVIARPRLGSTASVVLPAPPSARPPEPSSEASPPAPQAADDPTALLSREPSESAPVVESLLLPEVDESTAPEAEEAPAPDTAIEAEEAPAPDAAIEGDEPAAPDATIEAALGADEPSEDKSGHDAPATIESTPDAASAAAEPADESAGDERGAAAEETELLERPAGDAEPTIDDAAAPPVDAGEDATVETAKPEAETAEIVHDLASRDVPKAPSAEEDQTVDLDPTDALSLPITEGAEVADAGEATDVATAEGPTQADEVQAAPETEELDPAIDAASPVAESSEATSPEPPVDAEAHDPKDEESSGFASLAAATAARAESAQVAGVAVDEIKLETGAGAAIPTSDPSKSLLFQVEQAKAGRRRIAYGVVALLALTAAVLAFVFTRPPPPPTPEPEPEAVEPVVQEDIEIEATAASQALVARNTRVATLRAERALHGAAVSAASAAALAAAPEVAPDVGVEEEDRDTHRRSDDSRDDRDEDTGSVAATDDTEGTPDVERRLDRNGLALPTPTVAPTENRNNGPAADHFNEGMRTFINASISRCNQRHVAEEGALEQPRVEISITVLPSGRVRDLELASGLRGTAFGRCLQSHRERWLFPRFEGDAVTLQKTYVVQ